MDFLLVRHEDIKIAITRSDNIFFIFFYTFSFLQRLLIIRRSVELQCHVLV